MMGRKIAFFTEQFPPWGSGVARSAQRLANLLHQAGHEVTVITYDREIPFEDGVAIRECAGHPYRVLLVGPFHRSRGASFSDGDKAVFRRNWVMRVVEYLKANRPDLIHAYCLLDAGFLAQVCALELDLPCVVSCRGNDIGKNLFNLNKFAVMQWIFSRVNSLTFVNEHLARRARMFFPSINEKSVVIHNGIDLSAPYFNADAAIPPLPEGPLVGYIGRLGEKKGVAELTAAMERIDARLVLAGGFSGGTHDRYLKERLGKTAGADRIIFLNNRPWEEVPALLAKFDVFVQPSLDDGHPNALLEAMAMARPIVATDIFSDVCEHGKDALLVPPGNAGALRDALVRLLNEPHLAQELGRKALEKVRATFTPEAERDAYLAIYDQVLNG